MRDTNKSERYISRSIHYFKNALHFIEIGEAEKASELLWGCVAQALKATAAINNIELRSHRRIRNYAMELARSLNDISIKSTFDVAQNLHSNFYESGLLLEDVTIAAEQVKTMTAKLFLLIGNKQSSEEE